MKSSMMNFFKVRLQDDHDIVLVDRVPSMLTREEALDLAIWLVVSADRKADSGDSEFAVMLKGTLDPCESVRDPGPLLRR